VGENETASAVTVRAISVFFIHPSFHNRAFAEATIKIRDANVYIITFDLNGGVQEGIDTLSQKEFIRQITRGENAGELPRSTPLTFSREGYRFTGWFEDLNDETTRWSDDKEVTGDTILYAQWVETPDKFMLGDTTGDRRVTSADATNLARYFAGHYDHLDEMPICLLAADITGRGYVIPSDVTILTKWLFGH